MKKNENYLDRVAIKNPDIGWTSDDKGIVTLEKTNKGIANKLERYGESFMSIIRKYAVSDNEPTKKYDVAEMRANGLTGAYEPWTEREIEKLRFEYEVGIPIEKIAVNHGRTKGTIISRLKKEGLIEE